MGVVSLPARIRIKRRSMMVNSNGSHELERPAQTAVPSPSPAADLASTGPPPLVPWNQSPSNSKRKRASIGERPRDTPLLQSRAGWAREAADGGEGRPVSRISLKSLLDAEMKLVYSDTQSTPQELRERLASCTSALKCPAGEPGDAPPGPSRPHIDEWLSAALQDADACYRLKKYSAAAGRFTTALQLCSRGAVFGELASADYEDVTIAASFIESRLAACYLRMKRPAVALQHSLRSAMIADYVHWLSGDGEPHISNLIKLYWQGLLEDAITMEEDLSVLYTPCFGTASRDTALHAEETFRKLHPAFTAYIFTDPSGGHVLPQTTDWSSSSQHYVLTLGFRRSQDGGFLDKLLHRKCPSFTGPQVPVAAPDSMSLPRMCETLGRRILPVLDFIACTKLAVGVSAGSGLIERLQYADCLLQLRRCSAHAQELQYVLAELALAPYLQELGPADTALLQALMADTTDTLEGKQTGRERVWNAMLKRKSSQTSKLELNPDHTGKKNLPTPSHLFPNEGKKRKPSMFGRWA